MDAGEVDLNWEKGRQNGEGSLQADPQTHLGLTRRNGDATKE